MLAARTASRFAAMLTAMALAMIGAGCGDDGDGKSASPAQYAFSTTRLCALVPARDPAAAAFPPQPPVRVFGTDLGWTYERDGVITILFGDSYMRARGREADVFWVISTWHPYSVVLVKTRVKPE